MSVIYAAALRTTRLNAVVTAIDANAGDTGYLVIGDGTLNGAASATTGVITKLPMAATSGTVSGDTLTITPASLTATGANVLAGTASKAEIWDRATPTGAAHVIVSGLTVTTTAVGTGNVLLSTVTVGAGSTVTVSTATITHPNT